MVGTLWEHYCHEGIYVVCSEIKNLTVSAIIMWELWILMWPKETSPTLPYRRHLLVFVKLCIQVLQSSLEICVCTLDDQRDKLENELVDPDDFLLECSSAQRVLACLKRGDSV